MNTNHPSIPQTDQASHPSTLADGSTCSAKPAQEEMFAEFPSTAPTSISPAEVSDPSVLLNEIHDAASDGGLGVISRSVYAALKHFNDEDSVLAESIPILANLLDRGDERARSFAARLRRIPLTGETQAAADAPPQDEGEQESTPARGPVDLPPPSTRSKGQVPQTPVPVPLDRYRVAEPFKSLFGRDDRSFKLIRDRMRDHGFDPAFAVVVWREKAVVVDGTQRWDAAAEAGLKDGWVVERSFKDEAAALRFAIHCQNDRRNLTDAQLLKVLPHVDKPRPQGGDRRSAKSRIKTSDAGTGPSSVQTASELGVSKAKLERARGVLKDPTLAAQVEAGTISINAADEQRREKNRPGAGTAADAYRRMLQHLEKARVAVVHVDADAGDQISELAAVMASRLRKLDSQSSVPEGIHA